MVQERLRVENSRSVLASAGFAGKMKSPQRIIVAVVILTALVLYHRPSTSQILWNISTRVASHTEPITTSAPVSEQEVAVAPDRANSDASSSASDEGLEGMLASAATAGKTVIITTLNQAWAAKGTMIDIFLESFHKGENTESLLNHLVIVALDQISYERRRELHRHCFMVKTEGVEMLVTTPKRRTFSILVMNF